MGDFLGNDRWDATDEPSPRGSRAQRDARVAMREGRVTVEVPPYMVNAPEWAARWGESAPPVGTVLRWTSVQSGELVVSHVAICTADDTWQMTGAHNSETFASVAHLIANSPCSVAVAWRKIPTVEARPAGDDAVKDWAAQFLAEREVATPTEDH